MEGRVLFVHVLAEFTCDRCGGKTMRLTRAPYVDGQLGVGERPESVECNDCLTGDREAKAEEISTRRKQAAWRRKLEQMGSPPRIPTA